MCPVPNNRYSNYRYELNYAQQAEASSVWFTLVYTLICIQDAQYEYMDTTPSAVSFDKAWGFCDRKCFLSRENILTNNLQEVRTASPSG
jgi:hypothetical protein